VFHVSRLTLFRTLSRTELSGRQDQHNGPRRLPLLVNAGWNFYRKMTITLLNLLSEQASTGLQDYSGDLLFGMALGKAISGGKGFHKELKKLMHEAALGSQPSVRAMGVLRMIDAAIPSENPEGDGNISHTNLYEVAASGSITALSDLQNSNPGNAAESRAEFRRRGGYNRESAFASTFTCDEIRQMIITATQSDEPTVPVELTFKAKPGISHSGPDEAQDSLLHLAAAFGVSEAITRLTSDKHLGPGLDARNTEDETPLYKACMAGQYEAAQTLLHLGADSSVSVGRTSVTCLHWLFVFDASHMDRIASALISRGLSVDARVIPSVHYPGQDVIVFEEMVHYPFHRPIGTALHWAAHMESVDAVSHLLNNGACVDGLDEANVPDDGQSQTQKVKKQQSQTALSMAMYRGSPKMANYLLSRGANPSRTDGEGRTPLHMLAGDCWMQNRLFPIPLNMDQWCFHGSFNSCVEALATCVEAAKERGASLDTRRKDRNLTPLMDAVQSKNVCAVIALLNAGADANSCQDWSRNLPIHVWLTVEPDALAYPEGYFVALQKLLDSTTDIKRSHTAVTSLVLTNYSSHWKQKLVAILDHRHKIDINMRDESGMSLLMTWISLGIPNLNYLEGVAWLLTKGADITTKDKFGRDFLLYAAENFEIGDQDCLAILKTYLNHFATIPKNRVLNDCKDDHSGKSVLMALCQNCYIESVRHAIQNGIDVNHFDKNGRTALDITLESGNKMRLGLLSGYMIHHAGGQLPKTSDIKDADWHQAGFGDTHNESQSSQNNTTAMRDRYMTFPRLRVLLVEAGAKTGKQLGHRTTAPDIKQSERDLVEEFALEDFDPEIQPFYELWKDAYQYDDETEEEDAEWRSSQKGWSIPDVFRSKAIPPEAKGRAQ
jgi:ankyrin repeat protein